MSRTRYEPSATARLVRHGAGLIAAALMAMTLPNAAHAVVLTPGSSGLVFTQFGPILGTQGSRLASTSVNASAASFSANVRSAVYRNTGGTLDFYYQVSHTGPGSSGANDEITGFAASDFSGFFVDAFITPTDPDGLGPFKDVFNPVPGNMSTTRVGRSITGVALQVNQHAVGLNGLLQGENSATWIFRTDARAFRQGSFRVLGSTKLQALAFAPGVPEPGSWAMLIAGFGLVGMAARRRHGLNVVNA